VANENLPSPKPDDDLELSNLRYEAVLRSLDSQRDSLTEIRSRTGLLISAASISTSFLGSAAAKGSHGFPPKFLFAIIPFGISIAVALAILLPWPGWSFSLRGESFNAFLGEPARKAISALAGFIDKGVENNQRRLNIMSFLFVLSALALLWSIIAWIVVIE
jgi:hypothetical protein